MNNPRKIQFANGNITGSTYFATGDNLQHANKFLFSDGYCSFMTDCLLLFHYYMQKHMGDDSAVANENGTLKRFYIIIF